MKSLKERLDNLLVSGQWFPTRQKAKAAIMAGIVFVDGQRVDKAGTPIDPQAEILVKQGSCPYVSRGGLKLEKALDQFDLCLEDKIAMDMGASTGGFTDCMLQRGAQKVYAVDVGYGQLDYGLRQDSRVVNREKTNIRYLDVDEFSHPMDFISIDVSFISLNLIFPVAARLLAPEGDLICLVKPQFEAGRDQVGKKGIVRDPEIHREVLEKVLDYGQNQGLYPRGLSYSPIKGAKGNREYLLYLKKKFGKIDSQTLISQIVAQAHENL